MTENQKVSFLKKDDPLYSYSADILIIGFSLLLAGVYFNGIAAAYHAAVCIASAVISEYAGFKLVLKENRLGDLSAAATGLLISLCMPACAPLWVGCFACLFAILAAKLPFGGARSAPFVPAAAGICFVQLCFGGYMSVYPAVSGGLRHILSDSPDFVSGVGVNELLLSGKAVSGNLFGYLALLSGSYPGAIGTTCMLALLGAAAYLMIRRPTGVFTSAGYILSCAVFALMFPRVNSGRISSLFMELCAGSLVFTALLIVSDPVTAPQKPKKALLYGAAAGLICMIIRRFGKISDPPLFSVLIINAVSPLLFPDKTASARRKRPMKKPRAKEERKAVQNETES